MQVFNIKSFLEVTRPKGTFNLSEKSEVDSRVSGGNKNYLFIRFICEMKHFRLDVASHEMCFNQSYITSTIGFWFRPSWLVLKSPITIFQTILAWIISPCNFNLKELRPFYFSFQGFSCTSFRRSRNTRLRRWDFPYTSLLSSETTGFPRPEIAHWSGASSGPASSATQGFWPSTKVNLHSVGRAMLCSWKVLDNDRWVVPRH